MRNVQAVVDRYIAIWNESDPDRRRRLIEETWAERGRYADPLMASEGRAGFDAMVQGAQARFPGHELRLTSEVDAHRDQVRFAWALLHQASAAPVVAGVDFGQIAPDGRIQSITGFFDLVPQADGGS